MAKKIKSAFWRVLNRLLTVLGISSAFAACVPAYGPVTEYGMPEPMYGPVPAYGMPANNFVLEGTVTGTDGTPIKGIGVGVVNPNYDPNYTSPDYYYCDTTATDKDGNYKLEWRRSGTTFYIYAVDIDGEENGSYSDKLTEVNFTTRDYTDTSKSGYKKIKDIKLNAKEDLK